MLLWGDMPVQAFDQTPTDYKINLLCLESSLQKDNSVIIVIKFDIPSHWKLSSEHKKPRQFGLPLSFQWTLPKGASLEKIGGTQPITVNDNNSEERVYKGENLHFFKLSLGDIEGEKGIKGDLTHLIPLKVRTKGLFCHDRCLPFDETRYLDITFPRQLSSEEQEIKNIWEEILQQTNIPPSSHEEWSMLMLIIMGVIGGVVLNAMPCVFPILSLKIVHLLQYTTPQKRSLHTWGYALGVMGTFLSLGGGVIILQALGHQVGWGFQMQSPVFILMLMVIFFMLALNLSGFFEMPGFSFSIRENKEHEIRSVSYFLQSMGTGVVSTLAATPCTAPFMATSLGYALTASPVDIFMIMASLGFGFLVPFLLLSSMPRLLALLPKPGLWMVTFKESMAFPLYGTVLWLCWVLSHQIGKNAIFYGGGTLLLTAFCLWFYQKMKFLYPKGGRTIIFFSILMIILPFIYVSYYERPQKPERYTKEVFEKLLLEKKPVFIYATASWCVTCHVNEHVLDQQSIQQIIKEDHIRVLKADYTHHDKDVALFLKEHGHAGVPFYVFYDPSGKKHNLPQVLSEKNLLEAFKNA